MWDSVETKRALDNNSARRRVREDTYRFDGFASNLAFALAPSCRSADNVDACLRWVGSDGSSLSAHDPRKRVVHGPNYRPPYEAIVVDDKSGFVLHEVSANEPRHPALADKDHDALLVV